jgi:ABC-type Fe3+-hydroxamate transport system substrate-binding protein
MRSKLSLIVFSILLAIFMAGCSKKSTSNTNSNSNDGNSNVTATTTDDSNTEATTNDPSDDSPDTSPRDRTKGAAKNTAGQKTANGNATTAKHSSTKDEPVKSTEKEIKKKGDRLLRDTGGVIKEGERRVRGILNGTP